MKIKLINPKMSLRPMDSEYKRLLSPPLGLLTLGALTPKEHEVCLEDENICQIRYDDKSDLVGITVNVDTSTRAYKIAQEYKKRGIPVILGGIHVSANPQEALQYSDSVCIGEAENVWENVLRDVQIGNLQKTYFSKEPTNLGKVPKPNWGLINKSDYLYTNVIYTSRNCPFKCHFCYNSCEYTEDFRNRPVESIIEEIQTMETKHIMFIDDNFIGNIWWTKEFLQTIKPLHLKWNAAVSTNIVDHIDLLDLMKDTGCQSLFIGFENINQESLRSVHKYQNQIGKFEKLIQEIHKREIMINASLVFGFDGDTPLVFQETLDWLIAQKIETITVHILTPYPGTKLFDDFLAGNKINDFDWSHYNTANVVFIPNNLTKEELYNGYLWIYREFYSFKNIIKRIPKSKRQWMPYLLFNFGYRKFGKITSQLGRLGLMNSIGKLARRLSYNIG